MTPTILDPDFFPLFHAVQQSGIFSDSKTFCDMQPRRPLTQIYRDFSENHTARNFDLEAFVLENFEKVSISAPKVQPSDTPESHIHKLWPLLRRQDTDMAGESTRIPLPHPYIVPGGRFGEIYYWDSFFTFQGLTDISDIRGMVDNFTWLIQQYGHIPNGNRTYFLSRSQPPFFGLMLDHLSQRTGEKPSEESIAALETEMQFWCRGEDRIQAGESMFEHLIAIDGGMMFRYFDSDPRPRPESYAEDVALAEQFPPETRTAVFHHLRAACESGWDFSSRWMLDTRDLGSTHCGHILPCDLNALMVFNFDFLYRHTGNPAWRQKKQALQELSMKWLWSEADGFFCDYDLIRQRSTGKATAAMLFPLFVGIASKEQAAGVAAFTEAQLLQAGGIVTTLDGSGQQWDWPNGWAPLQFVAVKGLLHYGFEPLAHTIAARWVQMVETVFARTGKMMEKYNVVNPEAPGGGGEYPNQDGFGWTNGVYLAFKQLLNPER
ncbi:MAG: trehalase [Saprospiraceae bacterium]|jgi:alpha,alpha-trehalase|nr:trehalase [Saprospiraceae bacterium]MDP4820981.1 trehalase [Saprospiraceae bacterium]MDP4998938.1 trehalase [Saprospiraceae bacterium]